MRGVAAELGVGAMSLYRHVSDHAALVDLVRARVMATEVGSAAHASEHWRDDLRRLLHDARARLRRHPGAVVLFHSEIFRHPATARGMEAILACLARGGVPGERLARTAAALWSHTVGSVLAEQSAAAAWPGEEIAPPRRKAWVASMRHDLAAIAPRASVEAAAWSALSHDEVFAEGLDLLIAGFG